MQSEDRSVKARLGDVISGYDKLGHVRTCYGRLVQVTLY
jgi:hypothetical protein